MMYYYLVRSSFSLLRMSLVMLEVAVAVDDIADVDNMNSHWHCFYQNAVLLQEWRGYYGCGYGWCRS